MKFFPTVFTVLFLPALAVAGDLKPRAEVNFRAGTDRSILMTEFWVPLAQQSDRVLYGDLRLMGDDGDNREGNLGFGYRQISTEMNSVLGGNVWIDRRRTENGNHFHQLTLGVESLGDTIDLRANGYIQLNNTRTRVTPNIGSASPYLAGTGIFYDTNGSIVEEPQDGFDAEIGYRLPVLQKYIDATRVYAGGYHFRGDQTDNVTGFRLRTEAQVNSIFSVGARFQHDDPRGSQGFFEATLRFPFKSKKLLQEHGLKSRLDESPERDIDIVTGAKVDTGLMKPIVNTSTGTTQRILYVDNANTNGGDGSKDNPFNTLAAAQAALEDNDILYINRGDGTTTGMDKGIVITQNNVRLIGSGSALTYSGITLLEAGLAPVITNTILPTAGTDVNTGHGVFVTGDNIYISGITVTGSGYNGIRVAADGRLITSATVQNVTATGNYGTGIAFVVLNNGHIGTVTATDNNSSGNVTSVATASGIAAAISSSPDGSIDNIIIRNNTMNNNPGSGLSTSSNTGMIGNVLIENNTATNNTQYGLTIQTSNGGSMNSVIIQNNLTTSNTAAGIVTAGAFSNLNILNNISIDNKSHGVYIQTLGNTITKAVVSNNTLSNNLRGLYVLVGTDGVLNEIAINQNTMSNNTEYGLYIYASVASSVLSKAVVEYNNIIGNRTNGVYLQQGSGAVMNVDMGNGAFASAGQNRIFGNIGNDLNINRATVTAGSNWWNNGGAAPTRVTTANAGSGIYTTPLATDPRP